MRQERVPVICPECGWKGQRVPRDDEGPYGNCQQLIRWVGEPFTFCAAPLVKYTTPRHHVGTRR